MAELPTSFADLEPHAHWALPSERERLNRRLASSLAELTAFYQAMLPRMDAIAEHLAPLPVDALPPAERRLLQLGLMFMEAAVCVELFKSPDVPESLAAEHMQVYIEGIERQTGSAA